MNSIQNFSHPELGEIRVLDIDGAPWFIGKDVAAALGYVDTDQALRKRVDDECKQTRQIDGANQNHNMIVINEDGLLNLIFSCRRPCAKAFSKWVMNDIMPSLHSKKENDIAPKNDVIPFKNVESSVEAEEKVSVFNNPEFGEIRTLKEDGKILFCGKDVAIALGYSDTASAVKQHCPWWVKRLLWVETGIKADGSPAIRQTEMVFITEGDVYRLIAHSQLPSAMKFERWVFDEVLPSIRKHGLYATDELLDNPDLLISLAQELKREREKSKALEAENMVQKQAIADFQPIKQYVDVILSSKRAITVTQIAADYDISAIRLNEILHEEGLQWKVGGQWVLYRRYKGKGYTKSETIPFTHSDGTSDTKLFTKWTQKGRLLIHNILTKRGIMAKMDRTAA